MLWIDMWVHPYTDMPLNVELDFGEIRVWLSPSDVVKSLLRLQSPIDCIPHPYYIYIKCFSTLICCGLTYGCTLTLICLWKWRWILGKLGVWPSWSDVVKSLLRLHIPIECILCPYYKHNAFLHLDMLWIDMWGHPYTDMPLKVEMDSGEIGGMMAESECCQVIVEASKPHRLHPTSILYI